MNMQHVHHKHHIQHPAIVGQDSYPHLQSLKVYTYTIPANQSVIIPAQNNHFFILAATGTVGIWGDTFGQFDGLTQGQGMNNCPFNKLILSDQSGASNTVKLLIAPGEFTNQILQSLVSIQSSQILQLIRPEAESGHFTDGSALVANTASQVFAPASNVNGAVILSAGISDLQASSGNTVTLLYGTTAPTSILNGAIVLSSLESVAYSTLTLVSSGSLTFEQFVPAGNGLWFISASATTVNNLSLRHCRYKLL